MSKQTAQQAIDSLTGFEELAIIQAFDRDINTLVQTSSTFAARALIFTELTRQGQPAKDAKKSALALKISELDDYFADDEDEPFAEEPATDAGKDDAQSS